MAGALGYVPKSQAATRARMATGRIAVVAAFSAYPSYLRRLIGVMRGVSEDNIEVTLLDQESAARAASPALASPPVRGHVDGVIVMGQPIDEPTEQRLYDRGVPVVVVDTTSSRFSAVAIDDVQGGPACSGPPVGTGHGRVGYILEQQLRKRRPR